MLLTPGFPVVFVLVVKFHVPCQHLLEAHGCAFGKQLPHKARRPRGDLLPELPVLAVVEVPQLVVHKPLQVLQARPIQLQNLFYAQQDFRGAAKSSPSGGNSPSRPVAQAQVEDHVHGQLFSKARSHPLVQSRCDLREMMPHRLHPGVAVHRLDHRQEVLLIGIRPRSEAFLHIVPKDAAVRPKPPAGIPLPSREIKAPAWEHVLPAVQGIHCADHCPSPFYPMGLRKV